MMNDKNWPQAGLHGRARSAIGPIAIACVLPMLTFQAIAIELGLPVDCRLNQDCFVQNYVDVDPSQRARDYRCGGATYDGHKGTDFRLLSTSDSERNVAVLAAAPGTITAIRDGVRDRLIGNGISVPSNQACGNGVIIDHGQGWETQYCHLRRGSVAVRRGQVVRRGQRLGAIGYSGRSQFAHLHFSVRRDGRTIDPFSSRPIGHKCSNRSASALWVPNTTIPYLGSAIIQSGFSESPVSSKDAETSDMSQSSPTAQSPAIVYFVRLMHLRAGDQLQLALTGPAGLSVVENGKPIPRSKAHYTAFVGKRRRSAQWPAGRYHGRVRLLRNNRVILDRKIHLDM